jgi:hypothetical protein
MSEAISSFLYQASGGLVSLKTVSFAIFRDVASTSWAVSRVHTVLTVRVETIAEAGWDFHRFPRCVYKNVIPRRGFWHLLSSDRVTKVNTDSFRGENFAVIREIDLVGR